MEAVFGFLKFVVTTYTTPLMVGLSAIVAFIGVSRTLKETRRQHCDRATLDYIMGRNKDDRFLSCFKIARKLDLEEGFDMKSLATAEKSSDPDAEDIRYILNQYEYLAVGIKNNIYNEKMLKESIFSTTINLFKSTKPFIEAVNERIVKDGGKGSAYCEFEALARRWKIEGKENHKEHQPKWYQFWKWRISLYQKTDT